MKKILIIGGGFIGLNFASFLLKKKNTFTIVSQKILHRSIKLRDANYHKIKKITYNKKNFYNLIKNNKFEEIFFLGGSSDPRFSETNKMFSRKITITNVSKLLDSLKELKYRGNLYIASSCAIYGSTNKICSEIGKYKPISILGKHKYSCEKIAQTYSKQYKLKISILRFFSIYGPGLERQVIYDIYKKFKNDKEVYLFGKGKESRDFTYIEDACAMLYLIMKHLNKKSIKDRFNIFNIASGKRIKIKNLALAIKKILKSNKSIIFKKKVRSFDVKSWRADIKKLSKLNIKIKFSIKKGLIKTLRYYEKTNDEYRNFNFSSYDK